MNGGAGAPTLVGRGDELAIIMRLVTSARSGEGEVVLVEGEAGIGKTRLVQAVLDLSREKGFGVLEASCDEGERAMPFGVMVRAFSLRAESSDPARAGAGALLAQEDIASPHASPGIHFRVVELLGDIVERSAGDPQIIVLEDVHWADPSTLIALRSIARRIRALPAVLLVTMRSGHDNGSLHRVVDDLLRAGGTRLALGPLDRAGITALVGDLLGRVPEAPLLHRLSGASGNPMFITEFIHSLGDEASGGGGDETPPEFRLSVLRRLGHFPESTNKVIRMASVLGSVFSAADLSIVLETSVLDLATPLQHAIAGGVIGESGERLAFRHDLVRLAVYETIPLSLRRQLHRAAGRSLGAGGATPILVAHHLAIGAGDAEDDEAAAWLRRAASTAAPRAPAVAVELLERARALQSPSSPDRNPMLAELAMAMAWSGRLADAEALSIEVLARSVAPDVKGALRRGLVSALTWQGRAGEALAVATPDNELGERDATMLAAETALAKLFAFDLKGAAENAARAVSAAEASGHDVALCQALSVQTWVKTFMGRPLEGLEDANRAIAIADRSSEANISHPRLFPGMPLVVLDRLDDAENVMQAGRRIAEQMGLAWSLPLYHAHIGAKRFVAGDWDGAVAELESGLAIADDFDMNVPVNTAASSWLAAIHVHRDDLDAAEATIGNAMRRIRGGAPVGMGLLNWARSLLLEARGELREALALLQPAFEAFYIAGGNITDPWSAMTLVRLCTVTGDRDRAAALLPFIDKQAAMIGTPFMRGQALRCRGLVESSPELLLQAVVEMRGSPRPAERAATCEDAGVMLIDAGSKAESVTLLDEALGLYDELGAARDIARVRAALRRAGVRRSGKAQQSRATTGWESLTPTEIKVSALVAQRLSNPEVAERLFISRHTVESHLKSVYRKLQLTSRVQLTAETSKRIP